MRKILAVALVAGSTLAANAAHAGGNVYWSIGVNTVPLGGVISNAPGYYSPAPVYAYPPPALYVPAPQVYYPPLVVYEAPQVVYQRPMPVYRWGERRFWDRDRDGIPDRYDRHDERKRRHGDFRDRDRDGIPDRFDRYDNRRYGY
jgi:hypothetical protein